MFPGYPEMLTLCVIKGKIYGIKVDENVEKSKGTEKPFILYFCIKIFKYVYIYIYIFIYIYIYFRYRVH